jgi:hypothetical protein
MSREIHVRFCESLGVRFPWATHLYEGREYRSLSGLVKELTGTNHNGLLWFGIVKRLAKAKPAAAPTAPTPAAETTTD